jgi:transposase InsO family protein
MDDDEDYKSIKLPLFSDGSEWEAVVFELKINLEKIWKHSKQMDIVEYLDGVQPFCKTEYIKKADKIIYHAIVTAAKRESFARKMIMAAEHDDAVPQVKRNEGLKLFTLFQSTFLNKTKDQANLPNAQKEFFSTKQKKGESAKDYISRVDKAVSDLAILNEKVSTNSWLFILANGLLPEYKKCRDGVLFSEPDYDTVLKLKAKILKEETVLGLSKSDKQSSSSIEVANSAMDNCAHCKKKGHNKSECRKLKKEKEEKKAEKDKYWCDNCSVYGHTTDYCWWNPNNNAQSNSINQKGKGKQAKGKGKSKGQDRGKGKSKGKAKGGRGNGNYPAAYTPNSAYYTEEQQQWQNYDSITEITEVNEEPDWQDYNFLSIDRKETGQLKSFCEKIEEISEKMDALKKKNSPNGKSSNFDWKIFNSEIIKEEKDFKPAFVLFDQNAEDLTAWTQNNMWTHQDFELCTWGDHLTLTANQGRPECDLLFQTSEIGSIQNRLQLKLDEIKDRKAKGEKELWMFLDSGASRSVIGEKSPLMPHLYNLRETNGSCNIGNGTKLQYLQKGFITDENELTVVQDLQYDLYSAVSAAKRGISCILDYNDNGENQSYLLCKKTGVVTPLIERKKGILEIPLHLYIDSKEKGLLASEPATTLSMSTVSKFWYGLDRYQFDPQKRSNNKDELSLFMFDIINSLTEKQRDYLIHARLAHLPRKAILQMVKNGAKGLPYVGKFKELCRPCLEARQRAENHGKQTNRNPDGKPGEHLHSDLAIVNLPDFSGFKYVLTVVDEISDEVVIAMLKTKKAEDVLNHCKQIWKIISARNNNSKLKSWQFDRGGEFLNDLFDDWIVKSLGAKQLFSNVEHPWENGRAERSFGTIFAKARAMMKYADLPNGLWGKAVQHAVFLKNRCPSSRLNYLAPLQFRTGEKIDYKKLRVFGCPAQIFIRPKERSNNKLSSRSEKGTFIGMSKKGNGFIFRVQRTKETVEIDSADAKFNETFSDCRDKLGKIIKGGRVLDPDLTIEPEPTQTNKKEESRFSKKNFYSNLDTDSESEKGEKHSEEGDSNEVEIEINDDVEEQPKKMNSDQNGKTTEIKNKSSNENRDRTSKRRNMALNKIKNSNGFVTSPQRSSLETRAKRVNKPRDKFVPNFNPTHKRKQAIFSVLDLKHDDFNLDSDLIKLDLSNEEDETLMMVQDNNDYQEMDENIMNNMEAEINSHINSQLEIDEALTYKKEQEQMEEDIRYQDNALTEDIIASFEHLDIEEDEDTSLYYYCHNEILSSDDDIDENTDTDDEANEKIDLTNVKQTIALLVKQRKTIARLRARIDRLNEKIEKTQERLHGHLKRRRQHDNESSS